MKFIIEVLKKKGSRKHELTTTTTSSGEQSSKCGTKWKLHGSAVSPCQVEPTKTRTNYVGSRTTPEQVNWLPTTPYYNLERTRRAACNVTTTWLTFDVLLEFSFGTHMHWCRRASYNFLVIERMAPYMVCGIWRVVCCIVMRMALYIVRVFILKFETISNDNLMHILCYIMNEWHPSNICRLFML